MPANSFECFMATFCRCLLTSKRDLYKWNEPYKRHLQKRPAKKPTKETYIRKEPNTRNLQKKLTCMKRDLQKRPTKETYTKDLKPLRQHRVLWALRPYKRDVYMWKETYKRDLQKKPAATAVASCCAGSFVRRFLLQVSFHDEYVCFVASCVAVCCSVLQCVAVCCSVLQCVAVSCIFIGLFSLYTFL